MPVVLALAAAGALACTPLPKSFSVSPDSATARATAKIAGEGVLPGTPVEVLWNGQKGNVVARVEADARGRFTLPMTIPVLTPGAYSIVFVAPTPHGRTDVVGRVPFRLQASEGEVTATGSSPAWSSAPAGTPTPRSDQWGTLVGMTLAGTGSLTVMGAAVVLATRRRLAAAER